MKTRAILRWVLLAYVTACFGTIIAKEVRARGNGAAAPQTSASSAIMPSGTPPPKPAGGELSEKVVVTYFYGKVRCFTCRAIEAQAKEAIEKGMADFVSDGLVEWRTVNFDQPGNEHFREDYQLSSQSLVLSFQKDGKQLRWKNLERVWELVHTPEEFTAYVVSETHAFLTQKQADTSEISEAPPSETSRIAPTPPAAASHD